MISRSCLISPWGAEGVRRSAQRNREVEISLLPARLQPRSCKRSVNILLQRTPIQLSVLPSVAPMLQEVLVSPTAKLDISSLLKSSPSPSPPPRTTSSRPSISRSFSISATEPEPRLGTSPATSTASHFPASTAPSQPFNAPKRPGTGGKSALSLPATSSKRTASASPLESRQASKKTTRQWSKEDSEELVKLRFTGMTWIEIAARFHNRSEIACRLRFQNYLERKHPWTEEQKRTLAQLYNRYVISVGHVCSALFL